MATAPPVEVTLRDGRAVTIRPIRRDDSALTAEFIDGLSADSKHALFLGGVAHVSESDLRRLCEPAHARDMAYIATATDADGRVREVGLCRYAGVDPANGAEISVAVADAWQHRGLGKRLLRVLIEHARSNGVHRLYSTDSAGNAAMRRLAHDMGFSEARDPNDVHQVIYSLRV
jgi:RimJ/RimL family protein N-acetyltransferase